MWRILSAYMFSFLFVSFSFLVSFQMNLPKKNISMSVEPTNKKIVHWKNVEKLESLPVFLCRVFSWHRKNQIYQKKNQYVRKTYEQKKTTEKMWSKSVEILN